MRKIPISILSAGGHLARRIEIPPLIRHTRLGACQSSLVTSFYGLETNVSTGENRCKILVSGSDDSIPVKGVIEISPTTTEAMPWTSRAIRAQSLKNHGVLSPGAIPVQRYSSIEDRESPKRELNMMRKGDTAGPPYFNATMT